MEEKIFIGSVSTDGDKQLEDNYLQGPANWFGDLKKDDYTFISRNQYINGLYKVESVENVEDNELKYNFKYVKKFKQPLRSNKIVSSKYFKLDIITLNNATSMRSKGGKNFLPLIINSKYEFNKIESLDFENSSRYIWITNNKENIKDLCDGDIIFEIDGDYNLSNCYIYDKENNKLEQYNDMELLRFKNLKHCYNYCRNKYEKDLYPNLCKNIINTIENDNSYKFNVLKTAYCILKAEADQIDDIHFNKNNVQDNEDYIEDEEAFFEYNTIIYGIPGSGKSYYIQKCLDSLKNDNQWDRVTFYPEYSYSDFIGCYKINESEKIIPSLGIFTKILKKAVEDENHDYFLIIEEMNRGNAEAIFGDIFQLLDRDDNGDSKYPIYNDFISKCLYGIVDKRIKIPHNLYLVATINTSDQNVFNLDTAFGRRWNYERFDKERSLNECENDIFKTGMIVGTNVKWLSFIEQINKIIISSKKIWNKEDKQLGLFYISSDCLYNRENEKNNEKNMKKFINKVIRYLWFDVFYDSEEELIKQLDYIYINHNLMELYNNNMINSFDDLSKILMNIRNDQNEN